ncbi:transposase [Streptomyces sp. ARC32]
MTLGSGESDRIDVLDGPADRSARVAAGRVALDRSVAELSPTVFTSLPRADQRRKALMYLRGLLGATGRKSVRNIAAFLGDQVNDQGLHHFINDSTWEWAPMRAALGRHVLRRLPPRAYVVRPLLIPKSGTQSAGVTRMFSWERGQAVTAQQVTGIWGTAAGTASPLNWHLHLPSGAPPGTGPATDAGSGEPTAAEEEMVGAFLQTATALALPRRPVVLCAEHLDGIELAARLGAAGLPYLTKIAGDTWLLPHDTSLPGWGASLLQSGPLARMARAGRRVALVPSGASGTPELVVTVRVRLPALRDTAERAAAGGDLLLIGVSRGRSPWCDELWLTNMAHADQVALMQLVRVSRRVERHGVPLAEQVGIRDFVGRSYAGWNRHATLASVAHAAAELAGLRPDVDLPVAPGRPPRGGPASPRFTRTRRPARVTLSPTRAVAGRGGARAV